MGFWSSSLWENAISGSNSCSGASPHICLTAQGPPALLALQVLQAAETFWFPRLWIQRSASCSCISLTSSNIICQSFDSTFRPVSMSAFLNHNPRCLLSILLQQNSRDWPWPPSSCSSPHFLPSSHKLEAQLCFLSHPTLHPWKDCNQLWIVVTSPSNDGMHGHSQHALICMVGNVCAVSTQHQFVPIVWEPLL